MKAIIKFLHPTFRRDNGATPTWSTPGIICIAEFGKQSRRVIISLGNVALQHLYLTGVESRPLRRRASSLCPSHADPSHLPNFYIAFKPTCANFFIRQYSFFHPSNACNMSIRYISCHQTLAIISSPGRAPETCSNLTQKQSAHLCMDLMRPNVRFLIYFLSFLWVNQIRFLISCPPARRHTCQHYHWYSLISSYISNFLRPIFRPYNWWVLFVAVRPPAAAWWAKMNCPPHFALQMTIFPTICTICGCLSLFGKLFSSLRFGPDGLNE